MTTTFANDHPPAWPDAGPDVLTPVAEHDDLRTVARAILAKHAGIDQVRAAVEQVPTSLPVWDLLTEELDVAGIAVPEPLGGSGYGVRELAVVLEETGAALVPDPVLSSAVLGAQALAACEDAARLGDLLERTLRGTALVAVWIGAPEVVRATETAHGWTADGLVRRVLHGASADHVVVPAIGPDGPVLLVAEVATVARARDVVDTTRPQVDLDLVAAPARLLVGTAGFDQVQRRLTTLRDVAVAAEHTGIVGHLLDLTVDYVRTREQFGRPIGSFQAIKHRLADMLVDRERCRSASRYAAAALDTDPDGAAVAAAVAAAVCTEAVVRTAHETIQLHGGIGFTWEHPAHLYLRRALGDEGLFGSAREHRSRLAGLLGL